MVAVSYVEEAPVAEILPNKVRITVKSGDDVCIRVMERSVWRAFIETEYGRLLEADRRDRERVVDFKGKRRDH